RGLQDRLSLVIAKSVIEHFDAGVAATESIAATARHGALGRVDGWHPGLSVLAAMANVLPWLDAADRPRAVTHAGVRVATDTADRAPRHPLPALSKSGRSREGLRAWFRETVEVRDGAGAERVLATIVAEHGPRAALDAVLAACTDHRYTDVGHTLDYAIKCSELCDYLEGRGEELISILFTSLVPQLVQMQRMEETAAWRRPIDVAALVERFEPELARAFDPAAATTAAAAAAESGVDEPELVELLLGDEPAKSVEALFERMAGGASPVALAEAVVTTATRRVLHFGTANELADWDTVHHTLTYANAVAEGMRRAPSAELFRAVLDGAMSVYLDRFLNVPAATLPGDRTGSGGGRSPEALLDALLASYDGRSNVDGATDLSWAFLSAGGEPRELLRALGTAILREDSGQHEFQELELAWRRLDRRGDGAEPARLALVATARWVAARYPTPRAREQTFSIARRLQRGEPLYAG
ncbi:MAG: Rieske (2Fe-2S) protein, partial [Planctomycetota bacterium]|nr:Rieske (2Fe-2S) protein [Planctomycetota bacterium]